MGVSYVTYLDLYTLSKLFFTGSLLLLTWMIFINSWPFLLVKRLVQGDRPEQEVRGGTQHRGVNSEQRIRKGGGMGPKLHGSGNGDLSSSCILALGQAMLPLRIPASSSLHNPAFGLPEVVFSSNILWLHYVTSVVKGFFQIKNYLLNEPVIKLHSK